MQRVISFVCLLIFISNMAFSQKVESTSRRFIVIKEEKPIDLKPSYWIVKAGGGILHYEDGTTGNYNVMFGYQKQFSETGLYWGAQIGSALFDGDGPQPGVYIGPSLGIRKLISPKNQFDAHLGIDYVYHGGWDSHSSVMWELGIGTWLRNFLVELDYQGHVGYFGVGTGLTLNIGYRF